MNPYVLLGAIILLGVTHGFAFDKGRSYEEGKWQAKVAEQTQKARETEQMWQEVVNGTNQNWIAKNAATVRSLDIALASLRARPDRPLSGDSKTDCAGGTGAELFRADAEFLARLATRADRHRNALEACYAYADALRGGK